MSALGMPHSPNPPTDSVIPSVMPSIAEAGLETTLSMARTLAAGSHLPGGARPHAYPRCLWSGHI